MTEFRLKIEPELYELRVVGPRQSFLDNFLMDELPRELDRLARMQPVPEGKDGE